MANLAIIFLVTRSLVRWASIFNFLTFEPQVAYLDTMSFIGVETGYMFLFLLIVLDNQDGIERLVKIA